MSADVCSWCAGGLRHSDWGSYCSAACEYNAVLNAARAEGEAAGAARERAAVVGYLREQADEDHDPWLIHLADDVAAGQHWGAEAAMREAGEHGGAAGRGAR